MNIYVLWITVCCYLLLSNISVHAFVVIFTHTVLLDRANSVVSFIREEIIF